MEKGLKQVWSPPDMKYAFLRSMDQPDMAAFEIERLLAVDDLEECGSFVVGDVNSTHIELIPRLALTKKSLKLLFICGPDEVEQIIEETLWDEAIEGSFGVSCYGDMDDSHAKKYGGMIHDLQKEPVVDLSYPNTSIHFHAIEDVVLCGVHIHSLKGTMGDRKNQDRPWPHPTTISPKFARFMINSTGVPRGRLLDPFCGAGGLLIEGGSLGYSTIGYEIEKPMLGRAKENCAHFEVDAKLKLHDSTTTLEKCDCIVADLPFGKNSHVSGPIEDLYARFLHLAWDVTDNVVIGFEGSTELESFVGEWTVEGEFEIYVHKSMTRKIVVLGK